MKHFAAAVVAVLSLIAGPGGKDTWERDIADGLARNTTKGVVPQNLGRWDLPVVYENGCHVGVEGTVPRVCTVGEGVRTVLVSGDSHAAALYGAFSRWAEEEGWRFVTVTKRGCPIVDVRSASIAPTEINKQKPYEECYEWRKKAVKLIESLKPDLVVLPLLSRRDLLPGLGEAEWRRGIELTVKTLSKSSVIVVLGDDPHSPIDIPTCLERHRSKVQQCTVRRDVAVNTKRLRMEKEATERAGGFFYDTSWWYCGDSACPATIGGVVVRRDDNHITDTFSRKIAEVLPSALEKALSRVENGETPPRLRRCAYSPLRCSATLM